MGWRALCHLCSVNFKISGYDLAQYKWELNKIEELCEAAHKMEQVALAQEPAGLNRGLR